MFEYRVTKYDPAHRDVRGSYTRDEWTSISDIGAAFEGVILTETEYQRVEDAYISTAFAFFHEAGVGSLAVAGLENHADISLPFSNGSLLGVGEVGETIRSMLRAEYWCRLETEEAFLHIGYDYYMYVGVPRRCPDSELHAQRAGLFVEQIRSPYSE
jgi:hypothetical protein